MQLLHVSLRDAGCSRGVARGKFLPWVGTRYPAQSACSVTGGPHYPGHLTPAASVGPDFTDPEKPLGPNCGKCKGLEFSSPLP